MNKSSERFHQLIKRYFDLTITAEEENELWAYVKDPAYLDEIENHLPDAFNIHAEIPVEELDQARKQNILRYIFKQDAAKTDRVKLVRLWPRIAAAASILLFLSIGGYFLLHKKQPIQQSAQNQQPDIAPGSNKAILTLANGNKIIVTGASNQTLARQGNMFVNKTAEGKLDYQQASGDAGIEPVMNTLSTQMGGEMNLTLADGTEVKLDAASSITYPVAFNGKDRRVSITGQVYFKVKHNAKQPFFVTANGQTIEDIGTRFNVNAYESTQTTLVEGSIAVNGKKLVPGQQAVLAGNHIQISAVNTDEVAGWAQGVYQFNGQNIHTIMDQIKRWYDIDVAYDADVSQEKFYATVSRNKNISQIFYNLGYTQKVHFKIDGRRVTVMK